MLEFFQHHRKAILVAIIIFVGIPMAVLFGIPNPFGGQSYQDLDHTVIEVYGAPVDAQTFLNQYAGMVDRLRAQQQEVPTAAELVANKSIDEMIRGLVNDALLRHETASLPYRPDQEFLEARLREFPLFKDQQGNFNSGYFNQWVEARRNSGEDWNEIYDMVAAQAGRELYLALLTASGRVLESDIRDRFEMANTKIKVRYMQLEPPIESDEATLEEYYEQTKDRYQTVPERTALVVAFPLESKAPAVVREIIEKARAGEDFGALAEAHSIATSRRAGGLMDWLTESDGLPGFRKSVFDVEVGAVGEPVTGPLGLYIYKVEEVRTREDGGAREVLAREIVVSSRLPDDAANTVRDKAEALIASAGELGSLRAAADKAGLEALEIGPFTKRSFVLNGIPALDAGTVKSQLMRLDLGAVSNMFAGRENLYVGEVTALHPSREKTFEEARDEVETSWIGSYKLMMEYSDSLNEYVRLIDENLKSIGEIPAAYPELNAEVKTSKLFGVTDFLFDAGWFMDPRQVHEVLKDSEPGTLAGPVKDFQNQYFYVELIERQGPTEEMWENEWPEQRDQIRTFSYRGLADEHIADYLQHQLEVATEEGAVYQDWDAMFALLGVDPDAKPESAETEESDGAGGAEAVVIE